MTDSEQKPAKVIRASSGSTRLSASGKGKADGSADRCSPVVGV